MTLTTLERVERYRQERAHHDQIRQREVLAMALKPRASHAGIPFTSTGHKTKLKHAKMVDGKLVIEAPPAPSHVRAGQRRKKNKVTGAKPAK